MCSALAPADVVPHTLVQEVKDGACQVRKHCDSYGVYELVG